MGSRLIVLQRGGAGGTCDICGEHMEADDSAVYDVGLGNNMMARNDIRKAHRKCLQNDLEMALEVLELRNSIKMYSEI